mmetsp:Transcript_15612/g.23772  ORF Transcript_15612/g.23772 Transcript_15612/m.23772 type:complete len:430 (-) Transcript_15612:323-1612(-)
MEVDGHQVSFGIMPVVDASNAPPTPILVIVYWVDVLANILFFPEWRNYLPFGLESWNWISHKTPPLVTGVMQRHLISYAEYKEERGLTETTLENLYDYAFNTHSTALGKLTTPTAVAVLFVLVVIIRLVKMVLLPKFQRMGRLAGRKTHGAAWEAANEQRIVKFGEYVFRLIYHSGLCVYGLSFFWDKGWWSWKDGGHISLWSEYPHPVEPGMAWYYLTQAAYNVDALVSLIVLSFYLKFQSPVSSEGKIQTPIKIGWAETVRGDFQEMAIHHIATNLLIVGSSSVQVIRVGSAVFFVHDFSDILVDLSKLANFLKWKTTTIFCFVSMVLVWILFRLYLFPFYIIGTIFEYGYLLELLRIAHPLTYRVHNFHITSLLILIALLHLVWFMMFVRMGYLLVSKGEAHDLSEHKKGEKQNIVRDGEESKKTS